MKNISIFCLTLDPDHEKIIKKLSYIPVGLGDKVFTKECLSDKTGENISYKNRFYGEYTFHYWIWKNFLKQIKTEWVGFCQYRKFFAKRNISVNDISFKDLSELLIHEISEKDLLFDCMLGNKFSVKNFKVSKIVKKHFFEFLMNPQLVFNKDKRNLKFHFDLFHGKGNLEAAISLLDKNYQNDFKNYMDNNTEFYPHNMFICKTEKLKNYYEIIFPWLKKCENIFGFDDLNGYGKKRIYGFLAERFLSFWFSTNSKIKEVPIIGKDLTDYKNL